MAVSPDKSNAVWPPKSPYDALMSSPSGRKKWEERKSNARDRTPSPSPRRAIPVMDRSPFQLENKLARPFESDEEENEDEETLQLRLEAIEARLKLKKLQHSKAKQDERVSAASATRSSSHDALRKELTSGKAHSATYVQVPVSPTRRAAPRVEHTSPARVLLGIDKGLRAHDVSLKRARSTFAAAASAQKTPPRVKSFTERLAEGRVADVVREDKTQRIREARGRGFGISGATLKQETPPLSLLESARKKSRDRSNANAHSGPSLPSSSTTPGYQAAAKSTRPAQGKSASRSQAMSTEDALSLEPISGFHMTKRLIDSGALTSALADKELYPLPRLLKEVKSPDYYPPDCESDYVVFGIIASKSSPYDIKGGPQTKDSEPASTTSTTNDKKFLVLKLTDLKWEVDLFLFGAAFTKYWKLQPGTVLAVLNPAIMPPRPHARDTGRFSLKLTTSGDELLEIGTARDLAFCVSTKKDGGRCEAWIDRRVAEHCDFHVGLALDRARAGRMEVNTLFRYEGKKGKPGPREGKGGAASTTTGAPRSTGGFGRTDEESGERYFMGPARTGKGPAASASTLLDAEEQLAGPERMRRRLAEREREREIARKLSRRGGDGIGATYLRAGLAAHDALAVVTAGNDHSRSGATTSGVPRARLGFEGGREDEEEEEEEEEEEQKNAAALGLVRNATDVRLSPVKGRRKAPHEAGEALGWGGAFKRGLLDGGPGQRGQKRALSPEKGQVRVDSILSTGTKGRGSRSLSPKKKARFALERGIREPGRESLGGEGITSTTRDDSDDDLDII